MESSELHVAIIGAGKLCRSHDEFNNQTLFNLGLAGITFARFYLDTHPACRLLILEKDGCIGGVWNAGRQRHYPYSITISVTLT